MARIFITGASGFIGSNLVAYLTKQGHDLTCLGHHDWPFDETGWASLLAGYDAVVHLAGIAHRSEGWEAFDKLHHIGLLLARGAKSANVRQLIFISSIAAQTGITADSILSEDNIPQPQSLYGKAKLETERSLLAEGPSTTILRPVVVFGAGAKGNAKTITALARLSIPLPLGGLSAKRSWLSIHDLVAAIDCVLFNPKAYGEIYIVANPEPLTAAEIIGRIRAEMKRSEGIFYAPLAPIKLALSIIGKRSMWDRVDGQLIVSPAKLMRLGWRPTEGLIERIGT